MADRGQTIEFHTRSGVLTAKSIDGRVLLNFPAAAAEPCEADPALSQALGVTAQWVGKNQWDYLYLVESAEQLRQLDPDFRQMRRVTMRGAIVTSPSDDPRFDFISRFFAPGQNIDEDPVTGSAHCCLGPFWRERLGKSSLLAFQASARGGAVRVRVSDDQQRVLLGGQAVTVFEGTLQI